MSTFDQRGTIPDTSFCIIFWDTTYGRFGDNDTESRALKNKIEAEAEHMLEDVDIYPGASGPGWMIELPVAQIAFLAMAVSVFFQGKNILENLQAWNEMAIKVRRLLLGRKAVLSRSAAGALALDEVVAIHADPNLSKVTLAQYKTADSRFEKYDDASQRESSWQLEYHGTMIHVFEFDLDNNKYLAVVEGTDVGVQRIL